MGGMCAVSSRQTCESPWPLVEELLLIILLIRTPVFLDFNEIARKILDSQEGFGFGYPTYTGKTS